MSRFTRTLAWTTWAVVATLVVGCGKSDNTVTTPKGNGTGSDNPAADTALQTTPQKSQSQFQNYIDLFEHPKASACDKENASDKVDLLLWLEKEIEKKKNQPLRLPSEGPKITATKIPFREGFYFIHLDQRIQSHQWDTITLPNWNQLLELQKSYGQDKDPIHLVKLISGIQSRFFDDYRRIVGGDLVMKVKATELKDYSDLFRSLARGVALTSDQKKWIRARNHLSDPDTDPAQLVDQITTIHETYGFKKLGFVIKKSNTEAVIRFYAPLISDQEIQILNKHVAQFWTKPGVFELSFERSIVSPYVRPNFVRGSGGRAHANTATGEIVVYNGDDIATLRHEIGHILGFGERYVTEFNPDTCTYTQHSRTSEIMSNHTGNAPVSDADFDTLRSEYLNTP